MRALSATAAAARSARCIRGNRLQRATLSSRASSSPSSSDDQVLTGWDARAEWLARTLRRVPRLIGYANSDVFAPSLSPAHHALMFVALNAPQRLDLDVPQFLQGAAVATKRALEDASDEAFIRLTQKTPESRSQTPMTLSPAVRRMREYCLPACFEQLQASLQRRLAQGSHMRAMEVHVESVHLTRVQYACVSAREHDRQVLQDQLASFTDHDNADNQHHLHDEVDEPLAVERLQLQVEVRTLERLQSTRHSHSSTAITEMQQRNVYVARFASIVTNPDELDWRLASMAMRTRGKPVELSSTCVTHRPAIE